MDEKKKIKQTTLAIKPETKKKLEGLKDFVMKNESMNKFLEYLVDTNPKNIEYRNKLKENELKEEFVKKNMINPNISWKDFIKIKKEEEKNESKVEKAI